MQNNIVHEALRMQNAKSGIARMPLFAFPAEALRLAMLSAYWPKYVPSARGWAAIVRPDCDEPAATEP